MPVRTQFSLIPSAGNSWSIYPEDNTQLRKGDFGRLPEFPSLSPLIESYGVTALKLHHLVEAKPEEFPLYLQKIRLENGGQRDSKVTSTVPSDIGCIKPVCHHIKVCSGLLVEVVGNN